MSCTTINYATKVLTSVNDDLRITPLPVNSRIPEKFTITTTAAGAVDDEDLAVNALPIAVWPGDKLLFSGGTEAVVADVGLLSATTLKVVPLTGAIAAGETAETIGSYYIAATTNLAPNSQPKIVDATNHRSGVGYEAVTVGTNRTLDLTINRVIGDPGGQVIMEILYDDDYYDREVYATYIRGGNGETYEGAAIFTTGTQTSPVQDKVTLDCNLQFQGCSFKYTKATTAPIVTWDPEILFDEVTVATFTTTATTQTVDIQVVGTNAYRIEWGDGTETSGYAYNPRRYVDGVATHTITLYSRNVNAISSITVNGARLTEVDFAMDLPNLQTLNLENNQLTAINI